jgi:hypothetical protein
MDAVDALALAEFWRRVLGGTLVDLKDGSARIDPPEGADKTQVIWIDPVPEPRTGKTRVHLDLDLPAPDPGPLVAAGARVLSEPGADDHWWVLADVDGNEFCAFPPKEPEPRGYPGLARAFQFTVDCADPAAQAAWWASVLGGTVRMEAYGPVLDGADGVPWEHWLFQPVPEPKRVKNRKHWDVALPGPVPDELVNLGASIQRAPDDVISWYVLTDPEGNEFCAFPENASPDF